MKPLRYLVTCFIVILFSCNSNNNNSSKESLNTISKDSQTIRNEDTVIKKDINVQELKVINDTTFLLREIDSNLYHAIFIENNKSSQYYDWISDFKLMNSYTRYRLPSSASENNTNSKSFTKFPVNDLPNKWCPLYFYNDKYYLYSPCDYMNNVTFSINDSTFIYYSSEGPEGSIIKSLDRPDSNTYKFEVISLYLPRKNIIIHFIDRDRGIAIFEYPDEPKEYRYHFHVDAEKVKDFPIIVNYSKTCKQSEYRFPRPDYEKLIKAK
jgi:hypothetical protein